MWSIRRRLRGVMAVAGQSLATAAAPGPGVPIVGGLLDSIVGIVTGAAYGIGGAVKSVLASLGLIL